MEENEKKDIQIDQKSIKLNEEKLLKRNDQEDKTKQERDNQAKINNELLILEQ